MQRSFPLKLLFLSLTFLPFLSARGQDQSPVADASRQAKSDQSNEPKKSPEFITADTPSGLESCKSLRQAPGAAAQQDPALRTFLHSIAGRWNFAYVRRGNQSWWPVTIHRGPKTRFITFLVPRRCSLSSGPSSLYQPSLAVIYMVLAIGFQQNCLTWSFASLPIRRPRRRSDSSSHKTIRRWK